MPGLILLIKAPARQYGRLLTAARGTAPVPRPYRRIGRVSMSGRGWRSAAACAEMLASIMPYRPPGSFAGTPPRASTFSSRQDCTCPRPVNPPDPIASPARPRTALLQQRLAETNAGL